MSEKYTSRRREVEAVQVSWATADDIAQWCGGRVVTEKGFNNLEIPGINFPTLNGVDRASEGDYVVRNSSGTFQKMSRFAFESEFEREKVEDGEATVSHDPRERWRTL